MRDCMRMHVCVHACRAPVHAVRPCSPQPPCRPPQRALGPLRCTSKRPAPSAMRVTARSLPPHASPCANLWVHILARGLVTPQLTCTACNCPPCHPTGMSTSALVTAVSTWPCGHAGGLHATCKLALRTGAACGPFGLIGAHSAVHSINAHGNMVFKAQ